MIERETGRDRSRSIADAGREGEREGAEREREREGGRVTESERVTKRKREKKKEREGKIRMARVKIHFPWNKEGVGWGIRRDAGQSKGCTSGQHSRARAIVVSGRRRCAQVGGTLPRRGSWRVSKGGGGHAYAHALEKASGFFYVVVHIKDELRCAHQPVCVCARASVSELVSK